MTTRNVRTAPPIDKAGMIIRLCLPDARSNFSHNTAQCVDRERLQIKGCMKFASLREWHVEPWSWSVCLKRVGLETILKLAANSELRHDIASSTAQRESATTNGELLTDILRGGSEFSSREIPHRRIHRREILDLRNQRLRETYPVCTDGDPIWRTGRRFGWHTFMQIYRVVVATV
jgi:hypothetical protein